MAGNMKSQNMARYWVPMDYNAALKHIDTLRGQCAPLRTDTPETNNPTLVRHIRVLVSMLETKIEGRIAKDMGNEIKEMAATSLQPAYQALESIRQTLKEAKATDHKRAPRTEALQEKITKLPDTYRYVLSELLAFKQSLDATFDSVTERLNDALANKDKYKLSAGQAASYEALQEGLPELRTALDSHFEGVTKLIALENHRLVTYFEKVGNPGASSSLGL
jgi:hypothetical protein